MLKGLNDLAQKFFQNAQDHGFYVSPPSFMERMMLVVSEVSEAVEHHRSGMDPKVTFLTGDNKDKPDGIPIELADVLIRVLDACAYYGIDIEAAITRKHLYNVNRPYKHGKIA